MSTAAERAAIREAAAPVTVTEAAVEIGSLATLLARRGRLLSEKAHLEVLLAAVTRELDHLHTDLIPTAMQLAGVKSVKLASGGVLTVGQQVFVGLLAKNRPEAYAWLREQGHGDAIKVTATKRLSDEDVEVAEALGISVEEEVHHQTLRALMSELIEAKVVVPDIFNLTIRDVARVTGEKAKK